MTEYKNKFCISTYPCKFKEGNNCKSSTYCGLQRLTNSSWNKIKKSL